MSITAAAARKRPVGYAVTGFILGTGAPVAWTIIRLLLFPDPAQPLISQIFGDIYKNSYNLALYIYMGFGTAVIMAALGYFIGWKNDQLHERASELASLHREVAEQKEMFENRYKVLDNNIKNFHQISSRIQRSINVKEVLELCAEGLHDILGYERVNILMADEARENLNFITATGTAGFNAKGVTLPLDSRSGVIFKCFNERKLYLIDDITTYSRDYLLQPPFDNIKPLRSRSFVICPIVVRGESVGVFGIDNRFSHRSLNDTDVDTIKLFADQAGFAIIKINLLNAIETLTVELNRTFDAVLHDKEKFSSNVGNLEVAVDDVGEGTRNIITASESVMGSVDATSSAVTEISVSLDQVARNLEFLAENVEKSVSAMEEINQSIKVVDQNAAVSHEISSETKSQADRGMTVVNQTISALAELQGSVEQTYEGIRRLSDNSGRIDTIVGVINAIGKKTNLLALNASIIAAQAGEYGKSFGVVADEIRDLSLQTGQSTGEITGIIDEILEESRIADRNVALTRELVQKGVDLGRLVEEALKIILATSEQSMNMTREIKSATDEQAKSVQFVAHSIEDISTMTQQISNASGEQSRGLKSIVQAVESIKDLCKEMVKATAKQGEGNAQIRRNFESVSHIVSDLFAELEKRQEQSTVVVHELESIRRTAT